MNYVVSPNGKNSMIVSYDDDLKSHLRITDDLDEGLIKIYIKAAGGYIEKYLGKPILSDEIIVITTAFNYRINVPSTVSEIKKVEVFEDGVWSELVLDSYEMENYSIYNALYSEDFINFYQYRITCENDPCITPIMKQAAYLLIADYYENRENRNQNFTVFRPSVNSLLDLETTLI